MIIFATDGKQEITNKFKFFLKWYTEDSHEFNFTQYTDLFKSTFLYCLMMINNIKTKLIVNLKNHEVICIINNDKELVIPFGMISLKTGKKYDSNINNKFINDINEIIN